MSSSYHQNQLPRASHPPNSTTIETNQLEPTRFPFRNPKNLPHLSYSIQNFLVSFMTLCIAISDCLVTFYIWIPIGFLRSLLDKIILPIANSFLVKKTDHQLNDSQLSNHKVILISGASSGIGASLTNLYSQPGNIVILLARDPGRLNHIAKIARNRGAKIVETHSIDYTHEQADDMIHKVIHSACQNYGSIDLAVSLTGTVTFTDDDPMGPEPWGEETAKRLNKINISSTYTFIMAAWEVMKKQRSGKICIISSSLAMYCPPQFALYGATKANLLSFSQSLRSLSTPYGIQVNCICPGFIESGMVHDMLSAGSIMPKKLLADPHNMAKRIDEAVKQNEAVVIWPISQVLPLVMAGRMNWLNGDLSRWMTSKIGITGHMVS
ncbi:hypothetical protein O181_015016 [Austropuccinia psidii MF-1]|uniref:NAD(P)-binding protein n=1 Tax=Austropuccinia psidii MF-1 TaxID=1389203 RepID=A0A9Q3GPP5_9BASI|nr:hypothetical protein [Austropuccinia psidii MF-1]